MLLKIAFRNILRNGRRSLATAAAIALGALALTLFGEYRAMAVVGLETGYVRSLGHLTIYKKGYSDFGSARPEAYSLSGYRALLRLIADDPELGPLIAVATPTVSLGGIVSNPARDLSTTFFGSGFVPSARAKMQRWDAYRIFTQDPPPRFALRDGETGHAVIGTGLARILGLCGTPAIAGCQGAAIRPRLDLLSGSGGAPNVAGLVVNAAESQGAREIDDHYVGMHIKLAQRLLYGRGEAGVSAIVIQLKRSEDLPRARARLEALFAARHLPLELRDFKELAPSFNQIISVQLALFAFVSVVLFLIVLFTIANTMGTSVVERTVEIGTARAMGVRRSAIRRQFLIEGALLGAFGATAGLLIAVVLTFAINRAGITYHMPISASPIPLYLMDRNVAGLRAGIWAALVLLAVLASLIPAHRAARMKVVDALRFV